jgi:PQQ-dependent dehydrogenase (methanol/ethanol family)
MKTFIVWLSSGLLLIFSLSSMAQIENYQSVTDDMLLNPAPGDWLMYSRTYDNQRYSPLNQVNKDNIGDLDLVWTRDMNAGPQENIPLVHNGVMFVVSPPSILQAINATNGKLLWEYNRTLPDDLGDYVASIGRTRTLALYQDRVYYAASDGYLVALNATNGEVVWETQAHDYHNGTAHSTGPMVARGIVVTGRNCGDSRPGCYLAAHNAMTGELVWRFNTTAAPGDPGGDTWGGMPVERRLASPWGLPGAFDPDRNLLYWGTANSSPHTRIKRHDGNPFAVPLTAPSELYSNSTLALDINTGELKWYYQHLPGDDWDSDHTQERILIRSEFNPDPANVKWINPDIRRGESREMVVSIGEPGGVWVLDRNDGRFLWTMPFPYDTPDFHIADIDVRTGITSISRDKVLTREGETHTTCYQNTKSYWPMAYHPVKNALFVPYHDACVTRTGNMSIANGHSRVTHARAGSDPDAFAGLARIDMDTGKVTHLHKQRNPGNGAMLLTAGDLMFWGDMTGTMYAFDTDNGEVLWDARVEGIIQTSTITYSVNGRQYLAFLTGDGAAGTSGPLSVVKELKPVRGHNSINVFALPE